LPFLYKKTQILYKIFFSLKLNEKIFLGHGIFWCQITRYFNLFQQYPKIISSKFLIGEKLGDGHFAEVRMAVYRKTGLEVALKIIDISKTSNINMVNSEVNIMKRVSHPNICKLLEEYQTTASCYLILELVRGGDLFDTITESGMDFY
jgi:serine/threonine protein kinase